MDLERVCGDGEYDQTALPKMLKELIQMNSNKLTNNKATKKEIIL